MSPDEILARLLYRDGLMLIIDKPAGLAVHDSFVVGAWEGECVTDPRSPFFPVVIPWHKLAPLMNPGQLRDELLALH